MTLDHRLLDLLVCPVCKSALQPHRDGEGRLVEMQCKADRLGFPLRDGIMIMLEHEARNLDAPAGKAVTPAR